MTEKLDAIVIGTAQGGKPLAGALAQAGWKTAIIERGRVGGTCVIYAAEAEADQSGRRYFIDFEFHGPN